MPITSTLWLQAISLRIWVYQLLTQFLMLLLSQLALDPYSFSGHKVFEAPCGIGPQKSIGADQLDPHLLLLAAPFIIFIFFI